MSRAALKKELSGMTVPQLVEVILEAYGSRAEIKEYFEYFLNPDVDKLLDKYMKVVLKEINRVKRYQCKARVSVINKALKEFRAFKPGVDCEVRFISLTLEALALMEARYDLSDTQMGLVEKLAIDLLATTDAAEMPQVGIKALQRFVADDYTRATKYFKRVIKDAALEYNTEQYRRK